MKLRIPSFFGAAMLVAAASATVAPLAEYKASHPSTSKHTSTRPPVQCQPKAPSNPPRPSPARNRTCYVQSHGDGVTDDSPYILNAINDCNNGGHVVFSEGTEYIIGTALDLTFLKSIDLGKCLGHPRPCASPCMVQCCTDFRRISYG